MADSDITGAADWLAQQNQAAHAAAIPQPDDDPDRAARALDLSGATGVPATAIYHDQDNFEAQHKQALTQQLLKDNDFLRQFAVSHPLAPKIAADDWHNLDAMVDKLEKLGIPRPGKGVEVPAAKGVVDATVKGFSEGWGEGHLGDWMLSNQADADFIKNNPQAFGTMWLSMRALGDPIEIAMRGFNAAITGGAAGIREAYITAGGNEAQANRLTRDLIAGAQVAAAGQGGMGIHPEMVAKINEAARILKPYVEAGERPPVGIHPEIDKAYHEEAKIDIKNLDEAKKAVQATATAERAPELLIQNLKEKYGQGTIGVSADAIRALYGDKLPEPDDNILGWVEGLQEKLTTAEATGGDVQIPLADWLVKADPEVAKELHDHIRVRQGGMTLDEAKNMPKAEELKAANDTMEDIRGPYDELAKKVEAGEELTPEEQELVWKHGGQISELAGRKGHLGTKPSLKLVKPEEGIEPIAAREEEPNPQQTAVDTVRKSASLEPLNDRLEELIANDVRAWHAEQIAKLHNEGAYEVYSYKEGKPNLVGYAKKSKFYTENEEALVAKAMEVMDRIAPQHLGALIDTHGVTIGGVKVQGAYQQYRDRLPAILYDLTAGDAIGTVRHEAIHHLRQLGFFTEREWLTLVRTAIANKWVEKHNIDTRYADFGLEAQMEEAIAEEFKGWQHNPDAPHAAGGVFEKLQQFVEAIKKWIKEQGGEPTAEHLFAMVETGEIGRRKPTGPKNKEVYNPEPLAAREEGDIVEKASALGMTEIQYRKYMRLIAQRNAEDVERQTQLAAKDIRKRQTAEWKENEARVRDEVDTDIRQRPDMLADKFFRTGEIGSGRTAELPKLDASRLSPEQKAALPKEYYGRDGLSPDSVAGLFGYQSGEAMVNRLGILNEARKAKKLTPEEDFKATVDRETERRMQQQYGNLEQNVLKEAEDHVISPTQLDMLHEEVVALGTKAGANLPLGKGDLKAWVKQSFDQTAIGNLSTKQFLADAGKAGRLAEDSLLKGDAQEAFKQKQRQYLAVLMADQAKRLEKARDQFDKLAKRFSKREVAGVEPEYTNFIHDILMRVGQQVRRSVQDLQQAIASGEYKDLGDFVAGKEAGLREIPVADFLLDPNYRKPLEQLTAEEFRAVHDSIKTLVKNGRDELKIYKEGAEADLQTIKDQIVDQLKTLPEKVVGPPKGIKHTTRTAFASLLQMEALLNRFDRGDPKGVMSQYVMRGLSEAASYERDLERKYGKALTAIKDEADLYEQIDNPLFIDPHSVEQNAKGVPNFDDPNGRPMPFTREKLRAVMLYLGRQEGRDKIARGHGIDINNVLQWVNTKATKQDWDWVQKVWDIFDKVKKEADQMYRNLSGVAPESSEPIEIQTPHGTYRGGYYPIRYSPEFVGTSSKLKGPEALEQNNYVRATTPAGYTKKVTGYAAPLDLQLGNLGNHLRGMLHDIAFRPSVIEASKIFYDTRVQNTITKHYGLPYKNLLVPYLKDVANSANFRSDAQVVGARALEFFRQNIIGTLIGLNPGTVAKHGPTAAMNSITEVGPINFLKAVKDLLQTNDATGESNWRFAMDNSAELRSRHRNYEETLQGSQAQALGETSMRQTLMKFQATPVAISDLLSAVPTWLAKYRIEMQDHGVHGDAIYAADRAVRRAHGSVAITNRPALMRGGPLAQWMTSLYGFFSHMLNRQYELMWRAADSIEGIKKGEFDTFKQNAPQLMAGLFSYVIFPALVEEMVTPLTNDQKESWGKWMGKTLLKGVSSSWPLVREFADFALSNQRREPTTGLLTTSMKAVSDAIKDVSRGKESFSKQHAGATIQHGLTALGAMTGLANAQEGKILRFTHDYATGLARPKGMGDVIRGLRYGTMEKR